ncbi:hypothetical protein ADK98_24180 [Streptomyces sp. H036]|nr:hypothetical protein ADK98_24180 [Streptomyces sp. H036]
MERTGISNAVHRAARQSRETCEPRSRRAPAASRPRTISVPGKLRGGPHLSWPGLAWPGRIEVRAVPVPEPLKSIKLRLASRSSADH